MAISESSWHGCYDKSLKGFIVPDAFSHPAKFSLGLIERIYDYLLDRGYVHKGDTVGDPFGGVAVGGLAAAYRGLRWVGVELEPKFINLARANINLHRSKLEYLNLPLPQIIQGDSRRFDELIPGRDAVITSPPFTQGYQSGGGINKKGYGPNGEDKVGQRTYQAQGGDRVAGNIETLKEGSVDACISSPPYATISTGAGGLNTKPAKHPGQQSGRSAASSSQDTDQRYGDSEGQISRLKDGGIEAVVSSPPWEANAEGARKASKFKDPSAILKSGRGHGASDAAVLAQAERDAQNTYGESPGQIGKLKGGSVDAIATSPPYAGSIKNVEGCGTDPKASDRKCGPNSQQASREGYGNTSGQIGREDGETYWQAMAQVYLSCLKAIKPGGVLVLVLKDYVKDRKRVPLCDDTARLLEHIGFVEVERIHAMLVKETTHGDLFNGVDIKKKSRKSFFRRLAEAKGSPKIDFEEVIIARRP